MTNLKNSILSVAVLGVIAGCNTAPVKEAEKPFTNEVVEQSEAKDQENFLEGWERPNVTAYSPALKVMPKNDYLKPSPAKGVDVFPSGYSVERYRVFGDQLYNLVERVLVPTDYDFMIEPDAAKLNTRKAYTLQGDLPAVLKTIEEVYEVIVTLDENRFTFQKWAEYSVRLPEFNEQVVSDVSENLKLAGARSIRYEPMTKTLHYSVDFKSRERVASYLHKVRTLSPMIEYEVHFFEVSLPAGKGVDWSKYNQLVIKYDEELPEAEDGAQTSVLSCAESTLDATLLHKFLNTQGEVRFVRQPELVSFSGYPVKFGFSEKSTKGLGEIYKTEVSFKSSYSYGRVEGAVKVDVGTLIGANTINADSIKLINEDRISTYPGGAALITGIDARHRAEHENVQYIMLVKPSVTFIESPGHQHLLQATDQARMACNLEKSKRRDSITYRMMQKQNQ